MTTNRAMKMLALAAAGLMACAAGVAAGASTATGVTSQNHASTDLLPHRGVLSKIITVGTQPVTVTIDVGQVNVYAAVIPQLMTSITVYLSSNDGRPLSHAITAKRVTLERVKPPLRVERLELVPVATLVDDPYNKAYTPSFLPLFARSALLKATIRLETDEETRILRMGQLRVRGLGPILFDGADD